MPAPLAAVSDRGYKRSEFVSPIGVRDLYSHCLTPL